MYQRFKNFCIFFCRKVLKEHYLILIGISLIITGIVGFVHHLIHFTITLEDKIFYMIDTIAIITSLILITTGTISVFFTYYLKKK